MRFHKLKMEEINKIIKELWIKTYRGGGIWHCKAILIVQHGLLTQFIGLHSQSMLLVSNLTVGFFVCRY